MEPSDNNHELWILLNQVIRIISKGRTRETMSSGITPTQYSVIWAIKNTSGPATSTVIGRMIMRRPQVMTGLTRRMVTAGLIKRNKKSQKGEAVTFSVTEKGEKIYQEVIDSTIIPNAFSDLTDDERTQLYAHLKKVRNQAMKSLADKYALDSSHIVSDYNVR